MQSNVDIFSNAISIVYIVSITFNVLFRRIQIQNIYEMIFLPFRGKSTISQQQQQQQINSYTWKTNRKNILNNVHIHFYIYIEMYKYINPIHTIHWICSRHFFIPVDLPVSWHFHWKIKHIFLQFIVCSVYLYMLFIVSILFL